MARFVVFTRLILRLCLAEQNIGSDLRRQQEGRVQDRWTKIDTLAAQLRAAVLWLVLLGFTSGCVSQTYRYGLDRQGSAVPLDSPSHALTVSHGEPPRHLAHVERLVQWPRDAIRRSRGEAPFDSETTLERRAEAVSLAEEYLLANGVEELFIDVRTYDPREQWSRLQANERLHPLFRYTGGSLSWLRYTLLPRTVFRSDHYDPFTNTLSLNSAEPSRAILEAARAKEFHRERWIGRGAYAMLQLVPVVPLFHETRAASDALSYSEHHLEGQYLDELYPVAYSRIGATFVAEALSVFPLSPGIPFVARPLLVGSGRLSGRAVGRWASPQPPAAPKQAHQK